MHNKPIDIEGDYLIIAPKPGLGFGNHQMLTERDFLQENIENFLRRHPEVDRDSIAVYELKRIDWDSGIGRVTENKGAKSITELLSFENYSFGHVPFMENGYVINIENGFLPGTLHGLSRRHWHIHTVENNEVMGLCSLADEDLDKLIKFIEELKICD